MTSPSGRPGTSMVLSSAEVNGLLRPSPSSATLPGWVENAISVPTARMSTWARPRLTAPERVPSRRVRFCASGLSRQASRKMMLVRRVGLHAAQHQIEIDGAEIEIGLGFDLGVDRHEIVLAGDLQAVAGIEQAAPHWHPASLSLKLRTRLRMPEGRGRARGRRRSPTASMRRPCRSHRWPGSSVASRFCRPRCRSPARRACRQVRAR